jgi:hypothetical protein
LRDPIPAYEKELIFEKEISSKCCGLEKDGEISTEEEKEDSCAWHLN